jgi:hypothetical protein
MAFVEQPESVSTRYETSNQTRGVTALPSVIGEPGSEFISLFHGDLNNRSNRRSCRRDRRGYGSARCQPTDADLALSYFPRGGDLELSGFFRSVALYPSRLPGCFTAIDGQRRIERLPVLLALGADFLHLPLKFLTDFLLLFCVFLIASYQFCSGSAESTNI